MLPRNVLPSFTARGLYDLLRVSFPVQIFPLFFILASNYPSLPQIAGTLLTCFQLKFLRLSTRTHALEDMPSAPLSPVMPSEPNVLPVSPAPGSATSFTLAVPGPHPNVDHNTPATRHTQTLQGSSAIQPFSKILSDLGASPSEPDVDNAPSECNPPLTDRAFRYQRRDASRTARMIHAGMFHPTDTLSTFDPNASIEFPAQNSVPSRLLLAYSPSREFKTQHVAATCPPMTHAPTEIARPPFSAGARFSLRDFPPLVPPRALCSMTPPSPLRSRTASAAEPSRSTASPPALTAASADTSLVTLRAVSHSGEPRHRGLRPDAPVPSRTLNPGPPGPPPHLAQLTAVWHTLSAATKAELGHISSDQVAEGLELARFRDLALADEEHRKALDPLLQRASFLSCSETAALQDQERDEKQARESRTRHQLVSAQKRAVDDEIAVFHREHAARVAALTGNVYEPLSPDSPRTSAPPASLGLQDLALPPTTTATSVAHRALPLPTAAAAVTSAAAPVAAPAAAVPPAQLRSEHSAHVPPNTVTSVATRTLSQRPAASVTFAAAPVAAPAATVTDPAATMPPPTTATPWTVVAARPRRQPRTSSSSAAPTPDDSYLDLRVSRLIFENYRFPANSRIPIKELATAVDRALTELQGRKPRLRDAHRMATKDDSPFCARIVDDILRLVDLVRGCYATSDGACWVQNTLRDAAAVMTRLICTGKLTRSRSLMSPCCKAVKDDSRKHTVNLAEQTRGNSYILLFTDRFSRRADMFAVTTAEFTAEGTANILVNRFIPLWGCPSTLLSDNGSQFCARLATAVYKLLGIHKLTTSAYHPSGNGGVERVNHTMAQMLAMVCNEHQNDWDVHLPHVEYAYNNSVSAATGLAPNEVHIGRLPRLPLTVFDQSYGGTHQNLDRDQLAYCDLARERQQRAYELVRERHALTVARVNGRNSAPSDALLRRPQYAAGGWVWIYNTTATIRQGLRKAADNKVLKEKLSLNWAGPFKILAVGPASAANTPDGRPLGDKLLYLDLPSNLSGPAAKPRVTVARCKPCDNPYDADDIPRYLPAGLTQYVLHAFATKLPPYHVTTDDVSTPPILIDVAKITGHQCVRGRGGAIAVLYETHWNGILRPTCERELDLQAFRHLILAYWANGPDHHLPNTRQYQQLRINAAARELARAKGERYLPGSYRLVTTDVYRARFLSAPLPIGASIWFHSFDCSWWLGKIKQPSDVLGRYVVRFLDNPGPVLLDLPDSAYNTALHAPCGSWGLQTHGRTNPLQGVLHG